ncbi:hypothetical protein GCM10011515_07120 [Tsuneonella deserti]|uniref:Uncharacterized protein n=1 Tax=Tsuneonella deserti TaxID=2035528 RepID=A0ABQ1S234_9SPHN|nr:hypothetical protein GCM10011515_07120 [Tsuneonella deserti]
MQEGDRVIEQQVRRLMAEGKGPGAIKGAFLYLDTLRGFEHYTLFSREAQQPERRGKLIENALQVGCSCSSDREAGRTRRVGSALTDRVDRQFRKARK